jgi:hypothetical protein
MRMFFTFSKEIPLTQEAQGNQVDRVIQAALLAQKCPALRSFRPPLLALGFRTIQDCPVRPSVLDSRLALVAQPILACPFRQAIRECLPIQFHRDSLEAHVLPKREYKILYSIKLAHQIERCLHSWSARWALISWISFWSGQSWQSLHSSFAFFPWNAG